MEVLAIIHPASSYGLSFDLFKKRGLLDKILGRDFDYDGYHAGCPFAQNFEDIHEDGWEYVASDDTQHYSSCMDMPMPEKPYDPEELKKNLREHHDIDEFVVFLTNYDVEERKKRYDETKVDNDISHIEDLGGDENE